jgi:outer membrane protein OmpA-like peptidoglycan-associated protein
MVAVAAGLTALTACAQFNSEAGAIVDSGNFGNATFNNTAIQNGDQSYTIALAQRFADEVPEMVNFAFNSAELDEEARVILQEQAGWIRQFPEVRFRVYGHTDKVGSSGYNKQLGQRRANAVVAYLTSQGIERSRLEAVSSFGETRPLIVTEARERRNRRTVTEVTGFVGRHPDVLDGKYAQIIYRDYVVSGQSLTTLTGAEGTGGSGGGVTE